MGLFVFQRDQAKGKGKAGRKGSGRSGQGKKGRAAAEPSWDIETVRQAWRVGGHVVGVLTLVVGWVVIRGMLGDYAREHHAVPDRDSVEVRLLDQPSWMSDSIAQPITLEAKSALIADPFDGQGLQTAVKNLNQVPWIKQVHQVKRAEDGAIEITADFRTPVVAVRDSHRQSDHYLVDAEGVALAGPWRWSTVRDQGFAVIEGAAEIPVALGDPWPGQDFQFALELALYLAPEPFAAEIEGIHIERNPGATADINLALYTKNKRRVLWGAPLGMALVTETIQDEHKLNNIRQIYATYRRIDPVEGTIEVNYPNPLVVDDGI